MNRPLFPALLLSLLATPSVTLAQPAASSPRDGTLAKGLLSIARREAERERASLETRARTLLAELRSSPDDRIPYVQSRIDELATLGRPIVPILLAAMNEEGSEGGVMNAALNAARSIAKIPGQDVDEALTKLASEGTPAGRRQATIAIGRRRDPKLLEIAKERLGDDHLPVVAEAIYAIGRIGGQGVASTLIPFIGSRTPMIASAAIESVAPHGTPAVDKAVVTRLEAESTGAAESEGIVFAAIEYLSHRPVAGTVSLIRKPLANNTSTVRVRERAVAALLAAAVAQSRDKGAVLDGLRQAIELGPKSVVEEAAMAMAQLGDDSGIKAVTADLDVEIDSNSKNFNSRYKRAELFLRFSKWKYARRDFEAGLKIEKQARDPERVYLGIARACAGMGSFRDATRALQKLEGTDLTVLPQTYSEFHEMANDPRYQRIFEPKD